jgi:ABC-type multidrug transport system permease subunit
MKDFDVVRVQRLYHMCRRMIQCFMGLVISGMLLVVLGVFIAGTVARGAGSRGWTPLVLPVFAFMIAIACVFAAITFAIHIWITIIEVRTKSLTVRLAVSAFLAYGLLLLMALAGTGGTIWWGIKVLIKAYSL